MKFKDTIYGDLTGKVYKGNINVVGLGLTSLEGAPKEVRGYFYCNNNKLTSLIGSPRVIRGTFICNKNPITSLEGGPQKVNLSYVCDDCKLTTLKGAPTFVRGSFVADGNPGPYLNIEWELRKNNPTMAENHINAEMYKLTNDPNFIPETLRKVFLIKDKK